jgi:hypothetical protein
VAEHQIRHGEGATIDHVFVSTKETSRRIRKSDFGALVRVEFVLGLHLFNLLLLPAR